MKIILTNIILVFGTVVVSAQSTPGMHVTTKGKVEKRELRTAVTFVDSINVNKNSSSSLKIRKNNVVKIVDSSNVRKTALRLSNE